MSRGYNQPCARYQAAVSLSPVGVAIQSQTVPEIAVMAIEKISGMDRNIQAAARAAEARIAAAGRAGGC